MFLHWTGAGASTAIWEIINSSENNLQSIQEDTLGDPFDLQGVVRFGSYFVTVGSGTAPGPTQKALVYYSTDGVSWTEADPSMSECDRIFVGDGVVCLEYTGGVTPVIKYSSDLSTWNTASGLVDYRTFYMNGKYWQYTGSNSSQYSTNLSTWTTFTSNIVNPLEALYEDTIYVAIGANQMYSSTDGETWTTRTPTTPDDPAGAGNQSLAYGDGTWLIVGTYTNDGLYYSTNGTSWTRSLGYQTDGVSASFDSGSPEAIYTASAFYVVHDVDDIAFNSDPTTESWEGNSIDPGSNLGIGSGNAAISVASDGTRIIGVGGQGLIARYTL